MIQVLKAIVVAIYLFFFRLCLSFPLSHLKQRLRFCARYKSSLQISIRLVDVRQLNDTVEFLIAEHKNLLVTTSFWCFNFHRLLTLFALFNFFIIS